MILSDRDILKAMEEGKISVTPFDPKRLQPASVDVTLDKTFLLFDTVAHHVIDVRQPVDNLMRKVVIDENTPFVLHPGEFALAAIYEETGVNDEMVARLEGKSSLGRLGIIIHATAGYLDPGNKLKMTLELSNVGALPVKLYYRMPIGQISFSPLTSKCLKPYGRSELGSKYYGAQEPQASQMWKNFRDDQKTA